MRERYTYEKAETETAKLKKMVSNDEVSNYNEAEEVVKENQKYTDDYLDYLFDRLDDVGLTEKREEVENSFIEAVYDSKTKTISDACKELEVIIQLRAQSVEFLRAGLSINEKDVDIVDARFNLVHDIDASTNNQELFLGSGNIARVYSLADEPGLCVKKIINEVGYSQENSVASEARFQNDLSGFEVAGVRTPYVKETLSGGGLTVIVMEELDAVNFEIAAKGKAPIPAGFDIDDFFDRLKQYINAMHEEKGIFHKDLAPRNIMICNKTGNPFVIDFGRSEYLADAKNSELSKDKDFAGIEASRALMRKSLE